MRKRTRLTTLLVMPLAVFFWVIGWSLACIGSEKRKVKTNKKPDHNKLTFAVLMPEQKYVKQQTPAG